MPTPSKNITFTLGSDSVTVPGPPASTDVNPLPRFVSELSANHTRWTYQLTSTKTNQWSIPLQALNGTQKAALQAFFDNVVKGPSLTCTYTHTNGSSFTVRMIDTALVWIRNSDNMWDITLKLETNNEPL